MGTPRVLHMWAVQVHPTCCWLLRRWQAWVVSVHAQGQGGGVVMAVEHPGRWSYVTQHTPPLGKQLPAPVLTSL
jgi:hypothetical protein